MWERDEGVVLSVLSWGRERGRGLCVGAEEGRGNGRPSALRPCRIRGKEAGRGCARGAKRLLGNERKKESRRSTVCSTLDASEPYDTHLRPQGSSMSSSPSLSPVRYCFMEASVIAFAPSCSSLATVCTAYGLTYEVRLLSPDPASLLFLLLMPRRFRDLATE